MKNFRQVYPIWDVNGLTTNKMTQPQDSSISHTNKCNKLYHEGILQWIINSGSEVQNMEKCDITTLLIYSS